MKIIPAEEVNRQMRNAEANAVPPVVRYSKYKIQLKAQSLGIWEDLKAAIVSANLLDSWSNIQDIASDNAELISALPGIRHEFPNIDVDAFLAECVAD